MKILIDALVVATVWSFTIFVLKWEFFVPAQLGGYIILLLGNLIYHELISLPYVTNRWKSQYLKQTLIFEDEVAEEEYQTSSDFMNFL